MQNKNNVIIYEKKTTIGYSTIAKHGILKIVSIMNFLQDAASEHAHIMGISGFDLAKENFGWVIFRYHIEIKSHPNWQDNIIVRTHRFPCRNLYEIRVLDIIQDCDDGLLKKELVSAKGCWIMVNKNSKRPVRLSKFIANRVYCENNKYDDENGNLEDYFCDVIKPKTIHYQLPFKVRMHDLDLNGHVNNAIFVEWGVETVPEGILSKFYPSTIDVIFNKESLYGDFITSHTEIVENLDNILTLHSIIREQDQSELARLNVCWHKLPSNNNIL